LSLLLPDEEEFVEAAELDFFYVVLGLSAGISSDVDFEELIKAREKFVFIRFFPSQFV